MLNTLDNNNASPASSVHQRQIYRLNTDEKEQIAKAEREKRRKIRILQVREISRKNAATVRNAVRHEKLKQLQKLANNINNDFNKSKQQQLQELEDNYEKSLNNIGRAHLDAASQMENEDLKEISKSKNKLKAAYRHNAALERLHDDHVRKYVHDNKHIIARKAALEKEKERAAQIASLPKVPPGIRENIQQKLCLASVRNETVNQDEISYPGKAVVKRHHNESVEDGRRAAIIQEEKLDEQRNYAKSLAVEREQVAKIRFKKAIDKELLNRDSEKVMKELSFLQKKQMKQRQKQLSTIPKQVFMPPYKRAEALQDKQRIMEEKFEQFYVGDHMALKSDLNVLLEPHPPLESSHRTDCLDLTLTSDAETTPVKNVTNKPSVMKDITNVSLPSTQTATTKRQTLQTLFDRIKSQRDDWITDMAGNLQDAEVPIGKTNIGESSQSSPLPLSTESDTSPQVFSSPETDERVQENVLKDASCATMPLTNVVHKMEQIQKQLQQVSLPEEDAQQEVLEKSEDLQDMADDEDPARFQPITIASHLQKQIIEVLEQKKRIQEQKKHLQDRLREFDEHQDKTSLHGYSFNPAEFPIPSDDPSEGDSVHSPPDDGNSFVEHPKDGTQDVLDQQILNSESPLSDLNTGIDLHNQMLDPQSPNYLASVALKRLPKDIAKVQQYQQKMIHRHTERIKRIEEIQNDIRQNRKTLQDSISGISLPEADLKFDQTPSKRITTDPLIRDPLEHRVKSTGDVTTDVQMSSQGNALLTGFQPGVSLPFSSEVDYRILSSGNPSVDLILYSDPEGLSENNMDFLSASQSCIQESIAGNLFRSGFPGFVFNRDFQESNTVKEMHPPLSSLGGNVQYFQPEDISVETRLSEPDTPILGTTSKINSPCAFTPSFNDFDSFPGEPIPSSELQEIRKSLPFDETLEDSAQPTPVPSVTVSPHKITFPFYNDGAVSETKDINTSVPSSSDDTEIQGEFQRIKMQLEDVRKQKAKLCQRLMDGHLENQTESFGQEAIASRLDMNDRTPLVSEELSRPPKRHPPLLPMAYLNGHSPHELSAIQERDSSILSSHLSDMQSKLSLSSSVCSPSETTQTNIDQLVSGQLLEEKKLWNILQVLNHENLDNSSSSSNAHQSRNEPTSHSFGTATPFLSEFKDVDKNSAQPPTVVTVPEDQLTVQNANKIPQQLATTTKTWAEILLERSQLSANSESETSSSILQEVPNTNYDSQISLPTSTDTDSTVLKNFNFVPFINPRTVCQDTKRNVLAPSPSLGSLHCEPKSCETSSDESRLVPHVQTRDFSSFSTQAQESSETSSLANSEFHSRSSLTIDLLQNHKELSEFLSRILQTSEKFSSETLQSLPKAFSLNTDVQTTQNSPGISRPAHFSSTVSVSPSCKYERDSALSLYPSTVSDSIMSASGGKVTSSELFQVTNTTSESVVAHGPTSCVWSPTSVDNISNWSDIGHGPTLRIQSQNTANNIENRFIIRHEPTQNAWSPSTVDNISNTTSISPSDADSKTNSSDASLVSVIPLTSTAANQGMVPTVDIGKPVEHSSPSQITTPSPLTSRPAHQINTAMSSTLGKMDELNSDVPFSTRSFDVPFSTRSFSTNSPPTVSVFPDQARKEIMHATRFSQKFILSSSTPQKFLKSHPPTFPSNLSKLSQSRYAFSAGYGDANLSSSISANMISPIPQASSTSSSALTQYSISTSPESDNSVDIVNRFCDVQNDPAQQVKKLPSNPGYSLSSYYALSVSEGTAPSFAMKTMAGVELSKVAGNFLPSVATVIASLSSSSSSSSSSSPSLLVGSGPINLPQYQPPNQTSIKTNEISGNPDVQSLPSSSYQMQCMIQTQKFVSLKVSGKLSPSSSSSSSSSDVKEAGKFDRSQISASLPEIKPASTLPVIHDQPQSHESTPVSSENLSMTQYSYTSPETCDDPVLSRPSQMNPLILLPDPSTPPSDQLLQKPPIVKEKSNLAALASSFGSNLVPSLNDSSKYLSLIQDFAISPSPSAREGFKSSMSESCSSHSEKQGSPETEPQIREKSPIEKSSNDGSPSFVSLMSGKNATGSASSSDTNPEKVLPVEQPFQTTLDVDGAAAVAAASTSEISNLTPGVSSTAELTDSHCSSKMASSTDLSGLSQLSLPSDMMEDYQYLIRQARTLVKRGKADLLQEDRSRAYASGDSKLQSGMVSVYGQTVFRKDEHEEEDEPLSASEATNRDVTEMTETNSVRNQVFILDQLGISDEPNLSLVSSGGGETPTVKRRNQAEQVPMLAHTGLSSRDYVTRIADNLTENKESVTSRQRLDIDSHEKMRPDQTISNSVTEWKLKYSLATQTKK